MVWYGMHASIVHNCHLTGLSSLTSIITNSVNMQAMCCDYGFRSGVGRLYQGRTGEVPKNFFALVSVPCTQTQTHGLHYRPYALQSPIVAQTLAFTCILHCSCTLLCLSLSNPRKVILSNNHRRMSAGIVSVLSTVECLLVNSIHPSVPDSCRHVSSSLVFGYV